MYKLLKLFILQYVMIIVCVLLLLLMMATKSADAAFVERFTDDYAGGGAHQQPTGEFDSGRNEIEINCPFDLVDGGNVCDCGYRQENFLLPRMDGQISRIRVQNCKVIRIAASTFVHLSMLRTVELQNIEDLILDPESLAFNRRSSKVRLTLTNVVVEEWPSHAISGRVDEVVWERCRIGAIRAFAISGLVDGMFSFAMRNSTINQVDPQAFKKLSITQMTLAEVNFASALPSRAFYEMEIGQTLAIRNCSMPMPIFSAAFSIASVTNFQLANNHIGHMHGDAIQAVIKEVIRIQHNQLDVVNAAAFRSITLDPDYFSRHSERPPLDFVGNQIGTMMGDDDQTPAALSFAAPPFDVKISQLHFIHPISCRTVDAIKTDSFFTVHGESIYFRLDEGEDVGLATEFQPFSVIMQSICIPKSYLAYIVAGVGTLVLVLAVALIVVVVLFVRKRRAAQQLRVIQPDGRTYRETQIVVQIENAGLLKTDL